ncbi:hypothetical protein [Aeromonas allosaccharophila]|uniref:hypothetical protein n=1 Tax=Aeromonas allosaccharophila TaxID=656 RepID=UPI002ADFFFE5|nr:hypothetical protein [Aeromonas allosaccharophila]
MLEDFIKLIIAAFIGAGMTTIFTSLIERIKEARASETAKEKLNEEVLDILNILPDDMAVLCNTYKLLTRLKNGVDEHGIDKPGLPKAIDSHYLEVFFKDAYLSLTRSQREGIKTAISISKHIREDVESRRGRIHEIYNEQPMQYKNVITYYTSLYHLLNCYIEHGDRFSLKRLDASISSDEILSSIGLSLFK